jgi:hypothetical protein
MIARSDDVRSIQKSSPACHIERLAEMFLRESSARARLQMLFEAHRSALDSKFECDDELPRSIVAGLS